MGKAILPESSLVVHHSGYCALVDFELSRQLNLRLSSTIASPDFFQLGIVNFPQFVERPENKSVVALGVSTPRNGILIVLMWSAFVKMLGVAARRIVATMQHPESIFRWPSISQFKSYSVGAYVSSIFLRLPVSKWVPLLFPWPAIIRPLSIHPIPESGFKRGLLRPFCCSSFLSHFYVRFSISHGAILTAA